MDESKIKFGDKIFVYGQLITEETVQGQYNSVLGYMTIGGYKVWPEKTSLSNACITGFIVDLGSMDSLAVEMSFFSGVEDVTELLSLKSPLPIGAKVWMPIP